MSDNGKNIYKAAIFALIWVFLVTLAAFPSLFDDFVGFSLKICDFENVGRIAFLTMVVYIFDILVGTVYSSKEYMKNYFIHCLFLIILVCVFLQFAIVNKWYSIFLILVIDLSMGAMKGLSLYYKNTNNENELINV